MNYSQKQMWVTIPYRAITNNQMVKNEIEGISSFAQYIDFTGHVLVCRNQNLIPPIRSLCVKIFEVKVILVACYTEHQI